MTPAQPAVDELVNFYRSMLLVRETEQRLADLFRDGEIPGFIHLSIGQEAVAVGVAAALHPTDTVASNHRGHGHAITKGVDLDRFFLEVMGKAEGMCQGRGGSMHVADMQVGMLGANGIVAAGIPVALGSALAHQVRKNGNISVVFFGDGALAEGVLHECLNLAALWRLPMLFVCENNGWSEFSPTSKQFVADIASLAGAFKIPSRHINGNDVQAVAATARSLVSAARQGEGPQLLECATYRIRGHFEGDSQKYRDSAEISAAADLDPLLQARDRLQKNGMTTPELEAFSEEIRLRVNRAVAAGRAGSAPDFNAALRDVYTERQEPRYA